MDKKEYDKKVLDILFENYEEVYYWIQGDTDYDYIKELGLESKVNIIYSDLNEYTNFLKNNNCDYVGTRLHGGILAIDNRATEKHKDFNLPVIKREKLDELDNRINSKFSTEIVIPLDRINKWKKQFD